MAKKSRRRQKKYFMRGCSKKRRYRGGALGLAYTGEPIDLPPNPHLAYTGGMGVKAAYPNQGPRILPHGVVFNNAGPQKGGNCGGMCAATNVIGGGAGYPNGLVGQPTNPGNLSTLPGVDGIPGNRNHLGLNLYNDDPTRQMKLQGGRRGRRSRRRRMRGGGFLPDALVNLGRYIPYMSGSVYNGLLGKDPPVNPLPTSQPGLENTKDALIQNLAKV